MTPNKRLAALALAVAAMAAPLEGLRQVAYYDPPGILTVCRGHTGPDIDARKVYSLAECDKLINDDARKAVSIVLQCAPDAPDNVVLAFGDAVFNLGGRIACDKANSTAARMLAAHDWVGACNQLPRWDKARIGGVMVALPGLTTRRAIEREVCLRGLT